jgi:acyl homoserine lactone synthase
MAFDTVYRSDLSHHHEQQLSRYRHQIFVEKLGWELPGVAAGEERDQFDTEATLYVIRKDAAGNICGCARLLQTDQPYLLEVVFPDLFNGTLPKSADIWELSRLAVSKSDSNLSKAEDLLEGIQEMMRAIIQFAHDRGCRRLVGVTFLSMERLFRRMGIHCHRAGQPSLSDGKPIVACWIEIDAATCAALDIEL